MRIPVNAGKTASSLSRPTAPQVLSQLGKRLASVTYGVLHFQGQLGKRQAVFRNQKEGVITETFRPSRFIQDNAVQRAGKSSATAAGKTKGNDTAKCGGPPLLGKIGQFCEKPGVIICITG